jgi:hypothetical protein
VLTPAVAFQDNLSSFAFVRNSQHNTVMSDKTWAFHEDNPSGGSGNEPTGGYAAVFTL